MPPECQQALNANISVFSAPQIWSIYLYEFSIIDLAIVPASLLGIGITDTHFMSLQGFITSYTLSLRVSKKRSESIDTNYMESVQGSRFHYHWFDIFYPSFIHLTFCAVFCYMPFRLSR